MKGGEAIGLPFKPELIVGASVPLLALFALTLAAMFTQTLNPFLYFQF